MLICIIIGGIRMYNYEDDLLNVLSAISQGISRMAEAQERTANILEQLYKTKTNTSTTSTTKSEIDLNSLFL